MRIINRARNTRSLVTTKLLPSLPLTDFSANVTLTFFQRPAGPVRRLQRRLLFWACVRGRQGNKTTQKEIINSSEEDVYGQGQRLYPFDETDSMKTKKGTHKTDVSGGI